jgi:hypothetical protein
MSFGNGMEKTWLVKNNSIAFSKSSVRIAKDIYVGLFPKNLLKCIGSKIATEQGELTVASFLRDIGSSRIAKDIFPCAFANNSNWVYYSLFNNNPIRKQGVLKQLVKRNTLLDWGSVVSNSGVGSRARNSRVMWNRAIVRGMQNHRIDNYYGLNKDLLLRIRKRVLYNRPPSKRDVRLFRNFWLGQSSKLNHLYGATIFRQIAAKQIKEPHDMDMLLIRTFETIKRKGEYDEFALIILGYMIVRALYGINLVAENEKDEEWAKQDKRNVKKCAEISLTILKRKKELCTVNGITQIMSNLGKAHATGIPPLQEEAMELRKEQRVAVLKGFRLHSFKKILDQINRTLCS